MQSVANTRSESELWGRRRVHPYVIVCNDEKIFLAFLRDWECNWIGHMDIARSSCDRVFGQVARVQVTLVIIMRTKDHLLNAYELQGHTVTSMGADIL
jgi:hypothetical protein